MELQEAALLWAGILASLTLITTLLTIRQQLLYNSHRRMRMCVVRILLMAPLYAATSCMGIAWPHTAPIWDVLREVYEAIVIYSLFQLMMTFLGGEHQLRAALAARPLDQVPKHLFPCCCLAPWTASLPSTSDSIRAVTGHSLQEMAASVSHLRQHTPATTASATATTATASSADPELGGLSQPPPAPPSRYGPRLAYRRAPPSLLGSGGFLLLQPPGPNSCSSHDGDPLQLHPQQNQQQVPRELAEIGNDFVLNTQLGIFQYAIIRPLTALLAFVSHLAGVYEQGSFSPGGSYLYISSVVNVSQMWALYCLVLFNNGLREELSPIKPLAKFLSVKFVVFFTFWQALLISALVAWGFIEGSGGLEADEVGHSLQNLLIGVEMVIAAIIHIWAFDPRDFRDPRASRRAAAPLLRTLWDAANLSDVYLDDVRTVGKRLNPIGRRHRLKHRASNSNSSRAPGDPGLLVEEHKQSAAADGILELQRVQSQHRSPVRVGQDPPDLDDDDDDDDDADSDEELGFDPRYVHAFPGTGIGEAGRFSIGDFQDDGHAANEDEEEAAVFTMPTSSSLVSSMPRMLQALGSPSGAAYSRLDAEVSPRPMRLEIEPHWPLRQAKMDPELGPEGAAEGLPIGLFTIDGSLPDWPGAAARVDLSSDDEDVNVNGNSGGGSQLLSGLFSRAFSNLQPGYEALATSAPDDDC